MQPLISVLTPTYNSSITLPLALASLQAQTYSRWEWVLVDDGSSDDTGEFVASVRDPRVRYHRLPENQGAGYARQVTLEMARGEFITMLDSDDWIFPNKLEAQLAALQSNPALVLVSTGMAIVDRHNSIKAVRSTGNHKGLVVFPPLRGLRVRVPFAPSMIRADCARACHFDRSLHFSQDMDFLLNVMRGKPYGLLSDVLYAYSELESVTVAKIIATSRCTRALVMSRRTEFPIACYLTVALISFKVVFYVICNALGIFSWAVRRRSTSPTGVERQQFDEAAKLVMRTMKVRLQTEGNY